MDDARLTETVDYVAIRRLQSAYADVCTRRAWAEFDGLFLPDALVEVDTRVGEPLRFVGPTRSATSSATRSRAWTSSSSWC
jgi:hypothetical protein